jgi:hypothetical protein
VELVLILFVQVVADIPELMRVESMGMFEIAGE